MADRDSERDKRVRELLSDKSNRKNQMGVLGQANAEVQDIQSELQNHLAMQQMQDQARLKQTQTIAQAAQGMMAAEGGDVQGQVAAMNPQTQATMGKYGIKPQRTQNTSRTGSNQRTVSKSGDITNIKNESITNNRTEIRVTQPTIPISQPQIPVRQVQGGGGQAGNNAKFKAWLDGMFAKQQQEAEIQKKEYRRKEWNLGRTTNKLMKRIESSASSLGDKLNPANMSTTLVGQLKWLLMIFGATMIGKVWKPAMKTIANIDAGIRAAFGLPINEDLQQGGAKGISIVDKIKGFIGIEKGENTSLIGGIGKVFSEGIDKLIAKLELWMEDRSLAIKSVKFPKIDGPKSFPDKMMGKILSPLLNGVTTAFQGVGQYLGNIMSAAWGGSKGAAKAEANTIATKSQDTFTDTSGKEKSLGDSALSSGSGRNYMRKSDYNAFGGLKNEAGSTHAMSRSLMSLFDDTSKTSHTAEIGTGVSQIFSNAKTYGQVVIDPQLLKYLGLTGADINQLKDQGQLKQEQYKIIGVTPNAEQKKEMGAYTGLLGTGLLGTAGAAAGAYGGAVGTAALFAKIAGAAGTTLGPAGTLAGMILGGGAGFALGGILGSTGGLALDTAIEEWTSKGLYPTIVPASSMQESADGSPGIPKTMWVLTKEGADQVARKYLQNEEASATDMALNNKAFFDKLKSQERTRKTQNGVTGPLTENISTNNLQTQFSRQAAYEEKVKALDNDPRFGTVNRFTNNVSDLWNNAGSYAAQALDTAASWFHSDGGKVDKEEKQRRVNYSMKFFMDRGFTKEQAAGIVGNLSKEGLFQKDLGYAHTDGVGENKGDSAGIAQFHDLGSRGGELSNLKNFAKQRNLDWTDLDTQLLYLVEGSPRAKKALKKISEITETGDEAIDKASYIFGDEYEVFKGHADYNNSRHAERRDVAKTYYSSYNPDDIEVTKYSGELNLIQKSGNYISDQLHSFADYIRGDKEGGESESSSSGPKLSDKQKQIVAEYNKWKQSSRTTNLRNLERLGARTDASGTYFEMGGYRGYINPNATNGFFGLRNTDITHIARIDETGNLKVLDSNDHDEIDTAKSALIARVATFNTNYKGKGNGSTDYMLDGSGKALMFPLGEFKDYDSFRTEAARKDFEKRGGYKLYVFPSKDRSRETMICISDPKSNKPSHITATEIIASEYKHHGFDNNVRRWYYGDDDRAAIYWRGKQYIKWGCLETDKNATSDWYPVWSHFCCPRSLTPEGMRALAEFFELLSLGKIEGRTDSGYGKFTANGKELSKDQIEKAKKFGILTEHTAGYHEGEGVYHNRDGHKYFRMSDDLAGAQSDANLILKQGMTTGLTEYLKGLGLSENSSSKDLEKYFNEHRDQFQVVNGKVVDASGIQWGTFSDGKFSFSEGGALINGTTQKDMDENREAVNKLMSLKIGNVYGLGDLNSGLDFLKDTSKLVRSGNKKLLGNIEKNRTKYNLTEGVTNSIKVRNKVLKYQNVYDESGRLKKYRATPDAIKEYLGVSSISIDEGGLTSTSLEGLINQIHAMGNIAKIGKNQFDDLIKGEAEKYKLEEKLAKAILSDQKSHGAQITGIIIKDDGSASVFLDNENTLKYKLGRVPESKVYTGKEEFITSLNKVIREHSEHRTQAAGEMAFQNSDAAKYYKTVAEQINSGQLTEENDGVVYKDDGTVWIGDREIGTYTEEGKGDNKKRVVKGTTDWKVAYSNTVKDLGALSESPKMKMALLKRLFPGATEENGRLFIYNSNGTRVELDTTKPIPEDPSQITVEYFKKGKFAEVKDSKGNWHEVTNGQVKKNDDGTYSYRGRLSLSSSEDFTKVNREAFEQADQHTTENPFDAMSSALEDLNESFLESYDIQDLMLTAQDKQLKEEIESNKVALKQTVNQETMIALLGDIAGKSEDELKEIMDKLTAGHAQDQANIDAKKTLEKFSEAKNAGAATGTWRTLKLRDEDGIVRTHMYRRENIEYGNNGTWKVKTIDGKEIEGHGAIGGANSTINIGGNPQYLVSKTTQVIQAPSTEKPKPLPKTSKQNSSGGTQNQQSGASNG